jgi:hypothetical protein
MLRDLDDDDDDDDCDYENEFTEDTISDMLLQENNQHCQMNI